MLFELIDIGFAYADGASGLANISFDIADGERIAILGANGSGKSTLLRILDGLMSPQTGEVKFRSQDISEAILRANSRLNRDLRTSVGFVFQNADAQLFNATVEEEIAFGPIQLGFAEQEVKARVQETMAFLGIEHLSDRPPFRLSGGEKRKVAIASVLSMNPTVLIFDEPFLGLDPRSQTWLLRTISQLQASGKTTIIATHTLDLVPRIADRVILLSENHELLADGAVESVLGNQDLLCRANVIEREHSHATR